MERYYSVDIATSTGTPVSNPKITIVPLENALLLDIGVLIPSGHAGLTGVRVRFSSHTILPYNINTWIIADDYDHTFPINEEIGINTVSVLTYNTDIYTHTHYLKFHIVDLPQPKGQTTSEIGATALPAITGGLSSITDTVNVIPVLSSSDQALPGVLPPPPILTLP